MRIALVILGNLLFIGSAYGDFDYKTQTDNFWKKNLEPQVYAICRQQGTERPGTGKYDHFYEPGTYYCACCGGDHALYSSGTKFDSGTGWPSFYAPLANSVIEKTDKNDVVSGAFGMARTEVVCARCESHLGHVFNDGPAPTGKRYCMNSLTLSFAAEGKDPARNYSP